MEQPVVAAPQSLAEVEQVCFFFYHFLTPAQLSELLRFSLADHKLQLVKLFYTPGNPEVIHHAEQQLQTLQHSPEGWQMAERLLESDDSNVKFFGALTYTVKINTVGDELSKEDFASVQSRLIFWLVSSVFDSYQSKSLMNSM